MAFLPDMVANENLSRDGMSPDQLARIDVRPLLKRRIMLVTWKKFPFSQVNQSFLDELRVYGANWKGCVEPPSRR